MSTLVAVEVTAADIYTAAHAELATVRDRRLLVPLSAVLALMAARLGAPDLRDVACQELLVWLRHRHMCDDQTSLDAWWATAAPALVRAVLCQAGRHYAGGGAMHSATLPHTPLGPDMLEITAERLVGMVGPAPTLTGLVAMLRSVVVDALDVRGVAADRLAAELRDALGEHLLALGQHPHRTLARTVADWLLYASRGELITELQRAASWWRAALTPGRLR